MSWGSFTALLGLVADPLLAASAGNLNPPRGLAPHSGRLVLGAQPHTADGAIHTQTLVFTAGLEALSITIDHTIMLTACANHIWQRKDSTLTAKRDTLHTVV